MNFSIKQLVYLFIFFLFYTIFLIYIITFKSTRKASNKMYTFSAIELLRLLTNNNPDVYIGIEDCLRNDQDEKMCIYKYINPKIVKGKKKVMIGTKGDGAYVMLDDFENIKIAYSIGIDGKIQFDKALADKGIDVYMYDHTINKLPYENDKFHWKKIGIGGNSQRTSNIQTLEEMIKENGHISEKNMIFKIDVEYAEWDVMNEISENILNQFKYIIIEYHFFKDNLKLFYDVIKKIYKTHQPFYTNCCMGVAKVGNNRLWDCLEVSYIKREGNVFEKDKTIYPIQEFYFGNYVYNINILKLFDD